MRIPHDKGQLVSLIHQKGHVFAEEYTSDGVLLDVEVNQKLRAELKEYEEKSP